MGRRPPSWVKHKGNRRDLPVGRLRELQREATAQREATRRERDPGGARELAQALGEADRPFDPWCPYCGADTAVSGCYEGYCTGVDQSG